MGQRSIKTILLVAGTLLSVSAGYAAPKKALKTKGNLFQNPYIRFSLPKGWDCKLSSTVWTCRHKVPSHCKKTNTKECQSAKKLHSEAIMIFTAKQKGPKDSLRSYYNFLKQPITLAKRKKKRIRSKIIHTKRPKIAGLTWIDSLHLGSELPSYYTRYLTAIKGDVSVLVTFSAHKTLHGKYSKTFFETMKTLKVYASPTAPKRPNSRSKGKFVPQTPISPVVDIGGKICEGSNDPECDASMGLGPEFGGDSSEEEQQQLFLIIAAIVLFLAGLFVWKRKP